MLSDIGEKDHCIYPWSWNCIKFGKWWVCARYVIKSCQPIWRFNIMHRDEIHYFFQTLKSHVFHYGRVWRSTEFLFSSNPKKRTEISRLQIFIEIRPNRHPWWILIKADGIKLKNSANIEYLIEIPAETCNS